MIVKFIEAHDRTKFNHGKFMVARFGAPQWSHPSTVILTEEKRNRSLLNFCGWNRDHILVTDLQTGEGAIFRPGGYAKADLDKHKIWVCPMFEPFLTWLYKQDLKDLSTLPILVDLGDVPVSMSGYRRTGKADPEQG